MDLSIAHSLFSHSLLCSLLNSDHSSYWHEDSANAVKFPIYISVDGSDQRTLLFASTLSHAVRIQVIQNLQDEALCGAHGGYCHLSQHYKMLLQLFFECHKAPRLLFLEEDLEVAPDFFNYFAATAPVLDYDTSLLCVSAWNDHGQLGRANNVTALYRTDVLPGLGWMLTASVGRELHASWPRLYWDDWLREPQVRRGRQCVFPEVPRTHTYGKKGTSGGQHYMEHLHNMLISREAVNWPAQARWIA
jgi:alpha-1,3-mannosyl-glycoprotein beta-1,2-N-acetylglucosaminyltransferase